MTRPTPFLAALCLCMTAQGPPIDAQGGRPGSSDILRTPDGRNRTEMILKADHETTMKDIETMRRLIDEVKIEMEKNDRHVLSVGTLKKLDEIEKLTKKIRGRLKRY